jgi:copper(I)-binding protein
MSSIDLPGYSAGMYWAGEWFKILTVDSVEGCSFTLQSSAPKLITLSSAQTPQIARREIFSSVNRTS